MDIGATMGERLIFHSSLGFVVLVSYGLFELVKNWEASTKAEFDIWPNCGFNGRLRLGNDGKKFGLAK